MAKQHVSQSPIDEALTMAAVDACEMLRLWSDAKAITGEDDSRITPEKIGIFQQELKQRFAEIYFGTHKRLESFESTR